MKKYEPKPLTVADLIHDLKLEEDQNQIVNIRGCGDKIYSVATDCATGKVTLLTRKEDV